MTMIQIQINFPRDFLVQSNPYTATLTQIQMCKYDTNPNVKIQLSGGFSKKHPTTCGVQKCDSDTNVKEMPKIRFAKGTPQE